MNKLWIMLGSVLLRQREGFHYCNLAAFKNFSIMMETGQCILNILQSLFCNNMLADKVTELQE